jgi:hypothetical protein
VDFDKQVKDVREKIEALEKRFNEKPSGQSGTGSATISLSTGV